jgi:hypothetical protein
MTEMEDGFYWVLAAVAYGGRIDKARWLVAQKVGHTWMLPGDDCPYSNHHFEEIDERRIVQRDRLVLSALDERISALEGRTAVLEARMTRHGS